MYHMELKVTTIDKIDIYSDFWLLLTFVILDFPDGFQLFNLHELNSLALSSLSHVVRYEPLKV